MARPGITAGHERLETLLQLPSQYPRAGAWQTPRRCLPAPGGRKLHPCGAPARRPEEFLTWRKEPSAAALGGPRSDNQAVNVAKPPE